MVCTALCMAPERKSEKLPLPAAVVAAPVAAGFATILAAV